VANRAQVTWVDLSAPLGNVGKSLALPYNMGGKVGKSLAQPATVKAAVGKSLAMPYAAKVAVGKSLAQPYNVAGATTPVGNSLVLPFNVAGPWSPYYVDSFGRTVSNGLGSADQGGAYTAHGSTASSSLAVDGTEAVLTGLAAAAGTEIGATVAQLVAAGDGDYRIKAKVDVWPTGAGLRAGILLREQDSSNFYALAMVFNSSTGGINLSCARTVGGSRTDAIGGLIISGASAGTWYHLRVNVQDGTLKLRVWADGTAEPSTWHQTVTDASIVAPGRVGIFARATSGITNAPTVSIDEAAAGADGAVGVSLALPSKVKVAVGKSMVLPYPVRNAVGKSLAQPSKVNVIVGKSCALPSKVKVVVGKSLAAPAKVLVIVGASLAQLYAVKRIVGKSMAQQRTR
jgi:hypothetical protein